MNVDFLVLTHPGWLTGDCGLGHLEQLDHLAVLDVPVLGVADVHFQQAEVRVG